MSPTVFAFLLYHGVKTASTALHGGGNSCIMQHEKALKSQMAALEEKRFLRIEAPFPLAGAGS